MASLSTVEEDQDSEALADLMGRIIYGKWDGFFGGSETERTEEEWILKGH